MVALGIYINYPFKNPCLRHVSLDASSAGGFGESRTGMRLEYLAGCQKHWITNLLMLWGVPEITRYQAGS